MSYRHTAMSQTPAFGICGFSIQLSLLRACSPKDACAAVPIPRFPQGHDVVPYRIANTAAEFRATYLVQCHVSAPPYSYICGLHDRNAWCACGQRRFFLEEDGGRGNDRRYSVNRGTSRLLLVFSLFIAMWEYYSNTI